MHISLLEPFFSGSHRSWALELQQAAPFEVELLTLPGKFWKWRMHGGAITLSEEFLSRDLKTDIILASSMLDLTSFLALTREKTSHLKTALYFHENQFAYPWSDADEDPEKGRDLHYQFIQYNSALAADKIIFNSRYNRESFLNGVKSFLSTFPDYTHGEHLEILRGKAEVLPLGFDFSLMDENQIPKEINETPHLLWNHRWEYDKNPESFFKILFRLKEEGYQFKLHLLGERGKRVPAIFLEAKERLKEELITFDYLSDKSDYYKILWKSDIALNTSRHDFFGISMIEATYCQCYPLLPKGLAYPEHFLSQDHFYESEEEAYEKLVTLIREHPKKSFPKHRLNEYSWDNIIPQFIQLMENL